jgi:hypothetical protein
MYHRRIPVYIPITTTPILTTPILTTPIPIHIPTPTTFYDNTSILRLTIYRSSTEGLNIKYMS